MAADRTTQSDLLRTVYQNKMRKQFNVKSILLQAIERSNANVAEGEKISLPLHVGRTGGYGWSPTGFLPDAGEQAPRRAEFNYQRMYGRIQIDGPHVEGASASYAAEKRPYDFETTNLVKQMREALNFDLFGSGNGALCTFTADTGASGATRDFTCSSVKGIHQFQFVDLALTADGDTSDGFVHSQVVAVNPTTKVVTVSGLTAWDETAYNAAETTFSFFRSLKSTLISSPTSDGFNNVCEGLLSAIGTTGTYGNINRATAGNEWWKGQEIDTGSGTVAPYLSLLEEGCSLIDKYSTGTPNLIITTHELWNHLMNDLKDQKRFRGEMTLNGWARALEFIDIPIVRDKHCPDGSIFILDTSTFTIFQNDEGRWMDEDGAILHRVANRHAYEASWFRFLQLVCDTPNANCHIKDLVATHPAAPS